MEGRILARYARWLEKTAADAELARQLRDMAEDEAAIEDAFYRDLAFGTGGLRGILGAGTNRMNVFTVAKASQGLAEYVRKRFPSDRQAIAVSYDSRIKSDLFAQVASGVFAANGIRVHIYPRLMPTPCLSFAVRALGCAVGVMITASHNPAQYNGYKVYGPDGCQITNTAAEQILAEIEKLDEFADIRSVDFQAALDAGAIQYISEEMLTAFIGAVKRLSVLADAPAEKNISIVYTPLNGTGREPVLRILQESGFGNVAVVAEQERPDGRFPTCPYPNPEIPEAMELGLEYAEKRRARLLLATDPDCDRVGVAVQDRMGQYRLLTGNEVGVLLLDYICARRTETGAMPDRPLMIKTIVTTDLAERIAAHYGVETVNVLTGFKYIGEQISRLEAAGESERFIFGFEESCGYLSGTHARDKDGVNAALLICEMAAYYAAQGLGLAERLEELYEIYGYCLNTLRSYEFPGAAGADRMRQIMEQLRTAETLGTLVIKERLDYSAGLNGLPPADVLKFVLENGCSVVIRPSGTEPKMKVYISASADDRAKTEEAELALIQKLEQILT